MTPSKHHGTRADQPKFLYMALRVLLVLLCRSFGRDTGKLEFEPHKWEGVKQKFKQKVATTILKSSYYDLK